MIKYVWNPTEEQISFKSTLFPRSQNTVSQNSELESISSRSSMRSSRSSFGNFNPKMLKLKLRASSQNFAEDLLKLFSKKHRTLASQDYDLTEAFKTGSTITAVVPFDFLLPLVPYDAPNSPIPNSAVTNTVIDFGNSQTETKKPSASKELGDKLKRSLSNPFKKMKSALTHKKQYQLENVPGGADEGTTIPVRLFLKLQINSRLDSTTSVDSEPVTEENANTVTEDEDDSEDMPQTGSTTQSLDNEDSSLIIPRADSQEFVSQFENSSAKSFEEKFNIKKAVAEKIPTPVSKSPSNLAGSAPSLKIELIKEQKSGMKRSITDDSISSKNSSNPVSPRISKQKVIPQDNYQFMCEQLQQEKLQLQQEVRLLKASIEDHKNRLEKQLKSVEDEKQRHIEEKRILQLVDRNLRNRILELEANIQTLDTQFSSKNEQIKNLTSLVEEYKEQCTSLKSAVTTSLKEIAAKEKIVLQLETTNGESLEKVIEAKTENQRLQAIIVELEKKTATHKSMLQNPVLISFIWGSIASLVALLGLPFVFGISPTVNPIEFVYYTSGKHIALFLLFSFLVYFGLELSKGSGDIKLGTNILQYFEKDKMIKLLSKESIHENIVGSLSFGIKIGFGYTIATLVLFYLLQLLSFIQYAPQQDSNITFLSKFFYSIQEGTLGELFGRFFLFQFVLQVLNQIMQFAKQKSKQQQEQQVPNRFSQSKSSQLVKSQQHSSDDFVNRFSKWFVQYFGRAMEVFPADRPLNSVNNTVLNQYILDPIRTLSKANNSSTTVSKLTILGILLSSIIYALVSLFFTNSFEVVKIQWFGTLQSTQGFISVTLVFGIEFCKKLFLSIFLSYLFLVQQKVEFVIITHCTMSFIVNCFCL